MWPLHAVLIDKYQFPVSEAYEIADFLLPMLHVDIRKRATASNCLRSKWLHPYTSSVAFGESHRHDDLVDIQKGHTGQDTIITTSANPHPIT